MVQVSGTTGLIILLFGFIGVAIALKSESAQRFLGNLTGGNNR